MTAEYDWVEFKVRPKKDGLHDSGYRFLSVTGVRQGDSPADNVKVQLNEWADIINLYGVTYIDAEPDGTIRLMCRAGKWSHTDKGMSEAQFITSDPERTGQRIQLVAQFERDWQERIRDRR